MSTIWDAIEARDEALARVATPAIAVIWTVAAFDALVAVARRKERVTSDDVWDELRVRDISPPPEKRAMGPVMVRGRKEGVIRLVGYDRGTDPKHHRDLMAVYHSQILGRVAA